MCSFVFFAVGHGLEDSNLGRGVEIFAYYPYSSAYCFTVCCAMQETSSASAGVCNSTSCDAETACKSVTHHSNEAKHQPATQQKITGICQRISSKPDIRSVTEHQQITEICQRIS